MKKEQITINDYRIQYLIKADKRLAKVINMIGDINIYDYDDPYQFIIFEIVGQMLSKRVADVIIDRLNSLCDGEVSPDKIKELGYEELTSIGMSKAKAEYIISFTDAYIDGEIDFSDFDSETDKGVIDKLTSYRGIGMWTAKMYLIFMLKREDVLPYEDMAFVQGYRWLYKVSKCSKDEMIKKCKKWKPYSSLAARYLYKAVDEGLIKKEFHLYKEL